MHGILKITIYFILNIKMLNELKPAEVMDFLKERGYEVIELDWYTEKLYSIEHDWVLLLTGDYELVLWFLIWVYYMIAD